jgi:hypothetical protein
MMTYVIILDKIYSVSYFYFQRILFVNRRNIDRRHEIYVLYEKKYNTCGFVFLVYFLLSFYSIDVYNIFFCGTSYCLPLLICLGVYPGEHAIII